MTAPLMPEADGLRKTAASRHLLYGTAIGTFDISLEPRSRIIVRDCNIITPEYEMKWREISRNSAHSDFGAADSLVAFAAKHGMAFHGHTLWWHESIPDFLYEASSTQFADAALCNLRQTVSRYAGQLHSWDVINEPLEPAHGLERGLRRSRFLEAFGPDYIAEAFHEAAALDPEAVLVLNEMGLEYASPEAEEKRRLMLKLLERELAAGTPIDCLGIQSHLDAVEQPRHHPQLRAFLKEVDQLGLSVMITEMDVSDVRCSGSIAERDRMVAETYRAYIELVLEQTTVLSVSTWGLSDDRSWLGSHQPRGDGSPVRPLPLDGALRRKPAWHAIKAALLPANIRAALPDNEALTEPPN